MSPAEKTQLTEFLSTLDRNERSKLLKRASQLRKISPKRNPPRISFDEDGEEFYPKAKTASGLDDYLWKIVSAESDRQTMTFSSPKATVVGVAKTTCTLKNNEGELFVVSLKAKKGLEVAVGDEVYAETAEGKAVVKGQVPRRTVLSRPDVGNSSRERVIAANIDIVVIVVSIVSPPLHPRLIDRYLVAIQRGGCRAVIAVNKLDLAHGVEREKELSVLAPYRALEIPIFECSATESFGINELRSHLKANTAAFVGHSGVGKSSLINAFDERLNRPVGEVSEGYGRGTHTTTSSSLIDLGDLQVIDTPGIRSFGLWDMTADELPLYFPEFALAGRCKFSDCKHTCEPHCGVKRAVEEKQISRARYETYLRMRSSL